jgi:pantetheine-phosphate adenylyltransferase
MALTALYPGSFDPFTNGHLGITTRALKVIDTVIVGIATNSRKKTMFSVEERIEMIRSLFKDEPRVKVCTFEGLTVNYAAAVGAGVIIRGLRAVADFEYELQMANMNRKLNPNVETLFMMTAEEYFFVSSQNVKEVARFGGDISGLVPHAICRRVLQKLGHDPDDCISTK